MSVKTDDLDYTVKKIDDYTVEFTLEKPDSFFPYEELHYVAWPEHIWKDVDPAKWDEISDPKYFVGNGPFKISERKVGEYVKMVRNDSFWDGKPYLDGVIFQVIGDADAAAVAFETGQVQMSTVNFDTYTNLKDQPGFKFQSYPSGNMRVVLMNQNDPRLADLNVRTALSYCMDRKTMITVNKVVGGAMWSALPLLTLANKERRPGALVQHRESHQGPGGRRMETQRRRDPREGWPETRLHDDHVDIQ